MNNAFDYFVWEDWPSENTAVDQENLNKVNRGLQEVDKRVINLDDTKATKIEVSMLFKEVSLDEQTGIITFTRKNGASVTIDTPMEKIQTGIYYNPTSEKLVLPLIDGTTMEVDLSRLMKFDEFIDSDTIAFSVKPNGTVTAIVKEGSIEEKHLRPDYLADIKVEAAKAESSKTAAAQSATQSGAYSDLSKSYAIGTSGNVRPEDTEDNAKKYSEKSKASADTAKEYLTKVEKAGTDAVQAVNDALDMNVPNFVVDLLTGHLMYEGGSFMFNVNSSNGHLEWGLTL